MQSNSMSQLLEIDEPIQCARRRHIPRILPNPIKKLHGGAYCHEFKSVNNEEGRRN